MTTLQLERVNGTFFFSSFFEVKLTKSWGISRGYCNDLMYAYIVKGFPLLIINAWSPHVHLCVCLWWELSVGVVNLVTTVYTESSGFTHTWKCTLSPPSVFPASSKPRSHFSKSLTFCLFFWDSIYGTCSVCLAYSTWHNAFKVCLCCCKWKNFFFPHGWITVHHIHICVYHYFIHSGQTVLSQVNFAYCSPDTCDVLPTSGHLPS